MKKQIAPKDLQPENFSFSDPKQITKIINKYPPEYKKSALMPLLFLAQEECNGWIPTKAMAEIGRILNVTPLHVLEVASFYSMYNLSPIGKYHIQVCQTTPCWLCQSDNVLNAIKSFLEIDVSHTTEDNLFTLSVVECLGACTNAPIVQINNDFHENVTPESIVSILTCIKNDNM
ncbi:MAG: NADH-quinone oxidoreductase chain E [Candidatus Xenolissoclinum pacificiensis L6]|uniref:NADH-quinone oxidoreductase subunit E n=1 Tax=Candidatus Xenolissoclinum pacificiensis L6 TaxID=1401685 RepID=W2V2J7_9RICK|nr:MAG: NADH-quinone oxidoreductase chain E [Candidatus Xenolissoclinum pacificiensis L6]